MSNPTTNRRAFLRKTGLAAAATVTGIGLPQLSAPVSAGTNSHKWSTTTESTYNSHPDGKRLVQTTTLEWMWADWDPNTQGWKHRYRVNTLFAGRVIGSDTEENPALARQQLGIKRKDYDSLATFNTQPKLTGVYPTFQNGDPDYSSLGSLFETAISEMSSVAAFGFQAAAAIDKMVDAQAEGSNFTFHRDYDYNETEHADAHFYEEFTLNNWDSDNAEKPEDDEHHYWQMITMGTGAYGWVDTRQEWNMRAIKAEHPHKLSVNSSSVVQTAETEDGSKVYQTENGWTIEKIPPGLIKARQKTIDIPNEKARKHIKKNTPLYRARSGPVEVDKVNEVTGTGRAAENSE